MENQPSYFFVIPNYVVLAGRKNIIKRNVRDTLCRVLTLILQFCKLLMLIFCKQLPTWPTVNNITEEQARQLCTNALLTSQVFKICGHLELGFDAKVTACVTDIQVRNLPSVLPWCNLKGE